MKSMFSFRLPSVGNKVLFAAMAGLLLCSCDKSSLEGTLPYGFSVGADKQVVFSKGNLQYQASTATWRFAEHQYDVIGIGYAHIDETKSCYTGGNVADSDNQQIAAGYTGWIDLFGWGTGNNPIKTNVDKTDYADFSDWGGKAISNGGNKAWRTLTYDEWDYLFNRREEARWKYGVAEVAGIQGFVLLPDDWTAPKNVPFMFGMASEYHQTAYKTVNEYTVADWKQMEKNGAVFLPAAGSREGENVRQVGVSGYYWTSTDVNLYDAHYWYFYSSIVDSYYCNRYFGYSVRLCSDM